MNGWAAVLCSGPSLKKTWPVGTDLIGNYDIVIAVNLAMLYEPRAQWWCAGDWDTLKLFAGRPTVGICTIRDAAEIAHKVIPADRWNPAWKFIAWEDLAFREGKSGITALGLAVHLGASTVHIFGDDKAGDVDCTGYVDTNRGPDRWADEIRERDDLMRRARAESGVTFLQVRA